MAYLLSVSSGRRLSVPGGWLTDLSWLPALASSVNCSAAVHLAAHPTSRALRIFVGGKFEVSFNFALIRLTARPGFDSATPLSRWTVLTPICEARQDF